jgi:hypothetical protein
MRYPARQLTSFWHFLDRSAAFLQLNASSFNLNSRRNHSSFAFLWVNSSKVPRQAKWRYTQKTAATNSKASMKMRMPLRHGSYRLKARATGSMIAYRV